MHTFFTYRSSILPQPLLVDQNGIGNFAHPLAVNLGKIIRLCKN